ncbi:hypothetical protein BGZ76_011055 [Entomortierella beljakovae]|nr:hypothetical protein BGZ76_011055 [Entomortierella beljakovae]
MVTEKNRHELFQNFIYHCTQVATTASITSISSNLETNINNIWIRKSTASDTTEMEKRKILENMKSVAKLVATNSDFRLIISDLLQLAHDVTFDEVNHDHDKISRNKVRLSNSVALAVDNGESMFYQRIRRAAGMGNLSENTKTNVIDNPDDPMDSTVKSAQSGENTMPKRPKNVKTATSTSVYSVKKLSSEKRSALVMKFKSILKEIQSEPLYQATIDSAMELLGAWRNRVQEVKDNVASGGGDRTIQDSNISDAITEFQTILERWAQGYSLDTMIQLIKNILDQTIVDPHLSQYFDVLSVFFTRAIRDPKHVTTHQFNIELEELIDQSQSLLKSKYKIEFEALLDEGQAFIEKLDADPVVRRVADNLKQILSDICYNKHGKLSFKHQLFNDFRYVLIPSLLETFQYIPVPRIEYSDTKIDLMFDNICLSSNDLVPRVFEVQMNNSLRMAPRLCPEESQDMSQRNFVMIIEGLEAHLCGVDFQLQIKDRFRIKDQGVADVLIHKKGMDIRVEGRKTSDMAQGPSMITFDDVKVEIHSLSIKMLKSRHSLLNIFAQSFIKTAVKKAVTRALEAELYEALISCERAIATAIRDTRIKSGKDTFGIIVDTAASIVPNLTSSPEDRLYSAGRRKSSSQFSRNSRVVFDEDGLFVQDPIKQYELKVGHPLEEDINEMEKMGVAAPWVSPAFGLHESNCSGRHEGSRMRRPYGSFAM